MADEMNEPATVRERVIARYGWPLPPMAGAEEPDGDGAGAGDGGDGGEADGGTNEGGTTPDGTDETPGGDETPDDEVDDDFNRERALDTIRRQRAAEAAARRAAAAKDAQLKELEARLRRYEDANRSEDERRSLAFREAQEGRAAAEQEAARAVAEARRLRVVLDKGMTGAPALALAKRLVGETEEELAADADELLASFKTDDRREPNSENGGAKRRPQERLKPGGVPDAEPEENDPAKLAGRVSNSW